MPLTVGLTGGVAAGKSEVARAFAALGVPVLDADAVAREVVQPGAKGLARVAARFGPGILNPDGHLDRARLRERVFADAAARRDLEAILHPLIGARLRAWRDAQTAAYCVLVIPLLVETTGMDALVDRVLVVDAPVDLQRQRLQRRDGATGDLAQRMLSAQASREARLACADDVLRNDGRLETLPAQIAKLHRFYVSLAARNTPRAPGLHLP